MPRTGKEAVKAEQLGMAQDRGRRGTGQSVEESKGLENSTRKTPSCNQQQYGQMFSLLRTLLQKHPQLPGTAGSHMGVDISFS